MGLLERQKALRRSGISASEIASLVGLSRYTSPLEIWEAKQGREKELDAYVVDLGSEMEAPIARVWAKRHGKWLARVDTLRHPTRTLALATPDRAVYGSAEARGDGRALRPDVEGCEMLLEVKSTNWRQRPLWGDEHTDAVPDDYLCQAQWTLGVTGVDREDFAVDFDKTALREWTVLRDAEVFAQLYEVAERFWRDYVATSKPPPPDATDRYAEGLARVFPQEDQPRYYRPVLASDEPETAEAIQRFLLLREARSRLEVMLKEARNRLVYTIGSDAGVTGEFGTLTYHATRGRKNVAWKAYAEDLARIAALVVQTLPEGDMRASLVAEIRGLQDKHTTTSQGYRVLRVKKGGRADALEAQAEVQLALPRGAAGLNQEDNDG